MLNLRQVNVDSDRPHSHECDTAYRSTIRFNASIIIGNLGEPLDFSSRNDMEDESDDKIAARSSTSSVDARSVNHAGADTEVSERAV